MNELLMRATLKEYFGYERFRPLQEDIIRHILERKDCLVLMPTGGGKSICYQIPALMMEGTAVVVSPLISLMKDQVENLRANGIEAAALNSNASEEENREIAERAYRGEYKLLYVSPERLLSEIQFGVLHHSSGTLPTGKLKVSMFAVDEAHCISQWGYDFRPSYLRISDIRQLKPGVPVLALTATATPQVIDDIQERLGFEQKNVFRMSFERKNIAYVVRTTGNKAEELLHILRSMNGSAIVYVRSRRHAKEVSEFIESNNISSTFYHAGLDHATKDQRQKAWQDDENRVMVATNAFGMGIDKPDVRIVIHIDCPNSIEAYFQEAGRAGRDGEKAYAVLLYNNGDKSKLEKRIAEEFPDKATITKVYEHLAYFFQIAVGSGFGHTFALDIDRFCRTFHHFPTIANSALKILARAGYLEYETEPDSRTRMRFILERDQLYMLQSTTPNEEALIAAALREYSGLFVDYRYIDESRLAQLSGLDKQQVYLILKSLAQRHIISFIPQRSNPLVTYTRDRVLSEDIVIPPSVYEERKEQFANRIKSMVNYAMNGSMCRSRQLLMYFGEDNAHDCGQCDVCIAQRNSSDKDNEERETRQKILDLLADNEGHTLEELMSLAKQRESFDNALRYLLLEEIISSDNGTFHIK